MHVQIPMGSTSQPAGFEGLPFPEDHLQNTDHQTF